MSDKTIYDLGLNEYMTIECDVCVRRVPGGWIYENITACFVPYSEEFKQLTPFCDESQETVVMPAATKPPEKRRSIMNVVNQMIAIIPEKENPLYEALEKWHDEVFIELPEQNAHQWREVGAILGEYLHGRFHEQWVKDLIVIWRGEG